MSQPKTVKAVPARGAAVRIEKCERRQSVKRCMADGSPYSLKSAIPATWTSRRAKNGSNHENRNYGKKERAEEYKFTGNH
jgi:hypothetical protein